MSMLWLGSPQRIGQQHVSVSTCVYIVCNFCFSASGSDQDFNSVSSLLEFLPSETLDQQTVVVPVIINGDSSFEPNETFICVLSSPQPQELVLLQNPSTVTVTIADDDREDMCL